MYRKTWKRVRNMATIMLQSLFLVTWGSHGTRLLTRPRSKVRQPRGQETHKVYSKSLYTQQCLPFIQHFGFCVLDTSLHLYRFVYVSHQISSDISMHIWRICQIICPRFSLLYYWVTLERAIMHSFKLHSITSFMCYLHSLFGNVRFVQTDE